MIQTRLVDAVGACRGSECCAQCARAATQLESRATTHATRPRPHMGLPLMGIFIGATPVCIVCRAGLQCMHMLWLVGGHYVASGHFGANVHWDRIMRMACRYLINVRLVMNILFRHKFLTYASCLVSRPRAAYATASCYGIAEQTGREVEVEKLCHLRQGFSND